VGSREDWDIIEAALGFKDFDPQRRKALCRQLQITVKIYYPRLVPRCVNWRIILLLPRKRSPGRHLEHWPWMFAFAGMRKRPESHTLTFATRY
jgi:hypothetical protein